MAKRILGSVVSYLVAFLLIQLFVSLVGGVIWLIAQGTELQAALRQFNDNNFALDGTATAIIAATSSVLTIALFAWRKWSPVSNSYLRRRPWGTITWVALMACGTIIPSEWILERLNVEMSDSMQHLLEQIMASPWGYAALGILAPVAEEMVFRGAILRRLLQLFQPQWHWLPIVLSALLFGCVHGNMPQFVHATAMGLLLGWLYYRTGSIVPGIVLHWVNNTVAYVVSKLLPQAADSTLQEFLGGSERTVWFALGCSLCIFLPSLFQVALRTRRQSR